MNTRDEINRKNMEQIKKIITNYPHDLLNGYVNSMPKKTSYTKIGYIRYVCKFLDYIKDDLKYDINNVNTFNKIKPMHIDAFMELIKYKDNGEEKSATYRVAQLAAIKRFFIFLKKNEIIQNNPCKDIENPKDNREHEIVTISEEDMKIIINNIDQGVGSEEAIKKQMKWKNRDKAIVLLGVTTGLRISAMIGINVGDINLRKKTITVTEKGDNQRIIYIGDNTIKALKEWLKDRSEYIGNAKENAVFICQGNKRMTPRTMENIMKRITNGINKKITPHKMRATCATKLYESTRDIYLVQQQLGHKNIENTKRYTQISNERRIQAANILDSLY